MKIYYYDAGHITKMAAMHIKSFSPDLVGRFQRNLARSIKESSPSKFIQMVTLSRP